MILLRVPSYKGVRLSILFLGLYFFFLPFDFYRIEGVGSATRVLAYFPICFSIIEQLHTSHSLHFSVNAITKSCILLIFVSLLSFPFSVSYSTSSSALLTLLLNLFMVLLIGSDHKCSIKEVAYLEKCLAMGGWLTCVLMLLFSNFSINRMIFQLGDSKQDPNYMCGYILYAFCVQLKRTLCNKKVIDALLAGGMIVLVILSGSRGAMLSFLVAIFTSLIFSQDKKSIRKSVGGLIVLIIVFFAIYVFVLPHINSSIVERFTLQYLKKYGTVNRLDIWKYLLGKYLNSDVLRILFGYGYGTTPLVNDIPGVSYGHVAHNLYLELLISTGLMGVIAEIILQINCIKLAVRVHKSEVMCAYIAYMTLGMSLSITSYKPLWSIMIMLLIYLKQDVSDECVLKSNKTISMSSPDQNTFSCRYNSLS